MNKNMNLETKSLSFILLQKKRKIKQAKQLMFRVLSNLPRASPVNQCVTLSKPPRRYVTELVMILSASINARRYSVYKQTK